MTFSRSAEKKPEQKEIWHMITNMMLVIIK